MTDEKEWKVQEPGKAETEVKPVEVHVDVADLVMGNLGVVTISLFEFERRLKASYQRGLDVAGPRAERNLIEILYKLYEGEISPTDIKTEELDVQTSQWLLKVGDALVMAHKFDANMNEDVHGKECKLCSPEKTS